MTVKYFEALIFQLLASLSAKSACIIHLLSDGFDCVPVDDHSFAALEELVGPLVASPWRNDGITILLAETHEEIIRKRRLRRDEPADFAHTARALNGPLQIAVTAYKDFRPDAEKSDSHLT
ncbi:hypothetical protein AMK29_30630 [Streptomyces sp. CB02261]|nr:hypothetical protein AMK29_30630 [Streptomyces sp. CB02261]